MQHQVGDIKFKEPHQPTADFEQVRNGLVRATVTYIYPEGSKYAADAWFAPVIVVGATPVWTGQPDKDADVARKVAQEHLAEAMTKLLAF